MKKHLSIFLSTSLIFSCVQKEQPPVSFLDGLINIIEEDQNIALDQKIQDQMIVDQKITTVDMQSAGMMPIDMLVPDMQSAGMMGGMQVVDMMGAGMMGGGDMPLGPACDPRLYAQDCAVGFRCVPKVNGRVNEGFCIEGDHCKIGVTENNGCPADKPYCHLDGKATRCTQVGALLENAPCRMNDENLPCAEGLICNAGYCAKACFPSSTRTGCADDQRCVNVEEETGVAGGYCFSYGCDIFDNSGCSVGDKCNFAVRADGQYTGFCSIEGEAQLNEPCALVPEGGDTCAPGLFCIGPPNGGQTCRKLCDKGFYETSCPANQTCKEALRRSGNQIVYGVGICYANP